MRRFLMIAIVGLISTFLATTMFAQTTTDKATKAATDAAEKAKEAVGASTQQKPATPVKTEKPAAGSCHQISQICQNAGFDPGEAKIGTGLHKDCINPIMQGKTKVPGAKKPLPAVDPKLVAACKTENPKFGHGQIGSK